MALGGDLRDDLSDDLLDAAHDAVIFTKIHYDVHDCLGYRISGLGSRGKRMKDESKNLEFRSQEPAASRREEEEPRKAGITRIFLSTKEPGAS